MNSLLASIKFYANYIYYRLINKYSKEINILPWTTIEFRKGNKNRWYVHMGDRKAKLENVYNANSPEAFMTKFGFVSRSERSEAPSMFNPKYMIGSSTYCKEDVTKMGLVQKLVDQRIKAALDNTVKKLTKKQI